MIGFVAGFTGTLAGMLLLARALNKVADRTVSEDPNDVGYYLHEQQGTGPAVALRALSDDDLPACPDYIPEWMMPSARP